MSEADARAYLRGLAVLHLSMVLLPLGGVLAIAGLDVVGGPILVLAALGWTLALSAAGLRAARRNRGLPVFGGDSIAAEANWWTGWGPMAEAAASTNRSPGDTRRAAIASIFSGSRVMDLGRLRCFAALILRHTPQRRCPENRGMLNRQWIANDRRLRRTIEQMRTIAAKAAEIRLTYPEVKLQAKGWHR